MHRCIGVMALLLAACGGTSSAGTYTTTMNGANETPAVTTSGTGTATFTEQTNIGIGYTVTASNLTTNITQGHIHLGAVGVKGNVVVTLKIPVGNTSATVTDSFNAVDTGAKNLDGSTMTYGDLITAMRAGLTYVNIHTSKNPGGEIRGQLALQ